MYILPMDRHWSSHVGDLSKLMYKVMNSLDELLSSELLVLKILELWTFRQKLSSERTYSI